MTTVALTATGGGRSAARGGAQFPAPAAMHVLALGAAEGAMGARAVLAARGGALARIQGFVSGVPIRALTAWARGFGAGRGTASCGAALVGHAMGQMEAPPGAKFTVPIEALNVLTLTVRVPPLAAAPLAAASRIRGFTRAGAAFRVELQASAGARSTGQPGHQFRANLAARGAVGVIAAGAIGVVSQFAAAGRTLMLATARAAMTLLSPPPPTPPEDINPYYEIDC